MKKKILITGSSGFIGRNLKEQIAKDYELSAPLHEELELLDPEAVRRYLQRGGFDVILHCATWDATSTSQKDLSRVFPANLAMFFNLATQNDLFGKMIYFGSGAEYDLRHYQPQMKEEYFGTHVPADDYGLSKYVMAKYAREVAGIYNLRLFGVFGKYEDWRIRFISNVCCMAVCDLPITVKQNAVFDYMFIDDVVEVTRWFIKHEGRHNAYNVCRGETYELVDLARKVIEISGKKLEIVVKKEGIEKTYSGDNNRLRQEIGVIPRTPMDVAIKSLYSWYAQHKDLINREELLTVQ